MEKCQNTDGCGIFKINNKNLRTVSSRVFFIRGVVGVNLMQWGDIYALFYRQILFLFDQCQYGRSYVYRN